MNAKSNCPRCGNKNTSTFNSNFLICGSCHWVDDHQVQRIMNPKIGYNVTSESASVATR